MKKISMLSILSVLVLPAFAEETNIVEQTESAVVEKADLNADFQEPVYEEKSSNPEIKFPHGLQVGVGVSPLSGLNGFVGYNNKNFDSFWAKRFGVRFDLASYAPIKKDFNKELNKEGEDIKIKDLAIENFAVDGKHYGAIVDFYPFGDTWLFGGWRISGGYFSGELSLSADVSSKDDSGYNFDLNDHNYSYDDNTKATAKVKWKYSGPYVGTGFDLGLLWGFKIYLDAGVVISDKAAKTELNIPMEGLKFGGGLVLDDSNKITQFENDKKEELKKVQDEMDKYPYYPVVKLGVMFRF